MAGIRFIVTNQQGETMSNNFDGWKHINTAPKDREILVWDGRFREIVSWEQGLFIGGFVNSDGRVIHPTHWRGCPAPPVDALPDDPDDTDE